MKIETIEAITGLSGAAIIWYKFGFLVTLSVFLLLMSLQINIQTAIIKNR